VILFSYRAMHVSAKGGIAIACRPSVCLSVHPSVCIVGVWWIIQDYIGLKSWKLIARTISPTPSLLPGEHGEIVERLGGVGRKK